MVETASRNQSIAGPKSLEKTVRGPYRYGMVIQSIREFNRAVPFKPYEIRMASGERYVVPHSDFATVSPKGSFVIVFDRNERPHHLSSLLIECAAPLNGHHKRKGGKGASH